MNITRKIFLSTLASTLILIGSLGLAPAAAASSSTKHLVKEGGACVIAYGMTACQDADKSAKWAIGVTKDKVRKGVFKTYVDGSMANSFQHCTWMGALAVWHGYDTATGIGAIHETVNRNEYPLTKMDYFNNFTGASIGVEAVNSGVSDGWGYVIERCESLAKSGSLYGPCGIQGHYVGDGRAPLAPAEQQTCSPS